MDTAGTTIALQAQDRSIPSYGALDRVESIEDEVEATSLPQEVLTVFKLSFPIAISRASRKIYYNNNNLWLGKLGPQYLAATTLASQVSFIGNELVFGLCTPLGSMTSQAIGCGNPAKAGVWLQIALTSVTTAASLVAVVTCTETSTILDALGADVDLVQLGAQYNRWTVPTIFLWAWFSCLRHWARGMQVVTSIGVCRVLSLYFRKQDPKPLQDWWP